MRGEKLNGHICLKVGISTDINSTEYLVRRYLSYIENSTHS